MKKTILVIIAIMLLAGCGTKELLHEDFKKDVEQILPVLDAAYEEKRTPNEEERNLYNQFKKKYEIGQFTDSNDETYEMNDLEKAITYEIEFMRVFTNTDETLASEEDPYLESRNKVDEYLNMNKIPEELKGMHPTYEMYSGLHPEVKAYAQEIINSFDDVINGDRENISTQQINLLNNFISRFEGSFEVTGKKYLLNDIGYEILFMVKNLKSDMNSGQLLTKTVNEFNSIKERIEGAE